MKKPGTPKFQGPKSTENKPPQNRVLNTGLAVFLFSVSIVLISLFSVVFPAYIASNNSTITQLNDLGINLAEVNSFTPGVWATSLFVSNFAILGLAILYFKKKLPNSIRDSIDFVFSFEVSKKVAIITILVLFAIYIGSSVGDLATEERWEDYPAVKKRVEVWSPSQISGGFEPHVNYFLLWSSNVLFGKLTVIPFLASIALLLTTYYITKEISKKRFAGIMSTVILLQSNLFLSYDRTVSYTNFWILFYLLSLFLIYKAWPLSPVFYFLSIASKAMTAMFLPMSLYFIFCSNISRNKKIIAAISITIIILVGLFIAFTSNIDLAGGTGKNEEFDANEFWLGFTSFSYQLRFD